MIREVRHKRKPSSYVKPKKEGHPGRTKELPKPDVTPSKSTISTEQKTNRRKMPPPTPVRRRVYV